MRTISNIKIDFLNPTVDMINIEDIAQGLSMQARYNGHCLGFYSVAQHSVMVSRLVPKRLEKAALLHDAAEAYCGDVVKSLKELLPDYQKIYANFEKVIAEKYQVDFSHPWIKDADMVALATEIRDITEFTYSGPHKPAEEIKLMWTPQAAYHLFLQRWKEVND